MLRLRQHLLHQPRPLYRLGKSRIVFNIGRDRQLPALLQARDQRRLQHGPRGVDRSGVACWAGANDKDR
jgi:hypothetical protein